MRRAVKGVLRLKPPLPARAMFRFAQQIENSRVGDKSPCPIDVQAFALAAKTV